MLEEVLEYLCSENPLPEKHKDHLLVGNWGGHRECHILPDWLLIYKIEKDTLTRTGSHSDLF